MGTESSSITKTLKFKEELKAGFDEVKERIRLIEEALLKDNIYSKKCMETIRKICAEEGDLNQEEFRQKCSERPCSGKSNDNNCLLYILWEKNKGQFRKKCDVVEEILSQDVSNGHIVDFLNREVLRLMGRGLARAISVNIGNTNDKEGEILDVYFWPGYQSIWMERHPKRITLVDEDPENPPGLIETGIGIQFEK